MCIRTQAREFNWHQKTTILKHNLYKKVKLAILKVYIVRRCDVPIDSVVTRGHW